MNKKRKSSRSEVSKKRQGSTKRDAPRPAPKKFVDPADLMFRMTGQPVPGTVEFELERLRQDMLAMQQCILDVRAIWDSKMKPGTSVAMFQAELLRDIGARIGMHGPEGVERINRILHNERPPASHDNPPISYDTAAALHRNGYPTTPPATVELPLPKEVEATTPDGLMPDRFRDDIARNCVGAYDTNDETHI